jgi:hypothetical protein
MKLLTKANLAALPALYANDGKNAEDVPVPVKFFTPDSNWTWYATEYDPAEGRFFGLVCGHESELGYFMLAELEGARGPLGLKIERDRHWSGTLADAKAAG